MALDPETLLVILSVLSVLALKRFSYLFELPAQENLLEYLKRDFAVSRPSLSCSQVRQKVVAVLLHVCVIVLFHYHKRMVYHILWYLLTLYYFLHSFLCKLHWIFFGIFGHQCYCVKMSRIITGTHAMNDTLSCVIAFK